ncbi:acyl-CoA dehydrogenase family protein [Bradyrhizobium manausense]|uniref:acyl-CoA dehydrogenase family protein n=1 Tax=Bradyrhizobium manausense TaxID=989370 RepID=UPI001BAA0415|nr:acyl-CoA dehydrogenase family protein [Bradyrhizobium manausense]MBR0687705.1 acyl-CoA dehydrogenase family protein [Bradyrhizobium manausense]
MIPRTLFSEEHQIFREQCRALFEKEFVPQHAQWERDGIVPRSAWQFMGESGLLCTSVSEHLGGIGADRLMAVTMLEELSDLGLSGMALNFAMHSEIVTPYLVKYGSLEQKERWLPAMIRGERIGALAMTEPGGGSDLQRMKTVALPDGDGFRLNGQKTFISNGQLTNLAIVAAKTNPTEGARGISLFLVEGERAGFSKGRNLEKIGLHSADTSELFFDDVWIPAENLVGEEGQGFRYMMQELPWERLQLAIVAVAACEAAVRWTSDYCREREAFGRPIASFQNTQFRLAELRTETQIARVFVDRCIGLLLEGKLEIESAAMAKYWTTDLQCKVVDQCLQLHGGYGYMREYAIGRAFVDSRAQRIYGGTNEIMKEIISRTN